ncbi:MAG TPA: hypothetical protein VFF73_37995 [Planctomycetota bacterium]|nr:hypothetical protein [Planctomycetota bacterium]
MDEVRELLHERGWRGAEPEVCFLFADIDWKPHFSGDCRAEPAFGYSMGPRYLVLHRYPEGIRYLLAPTQSNPNRETELGVVDDAEAAAALVVEWLGGAEFAALTPRRTSPPWQKPN